MKRFLPILFIALISISPALMAKQAENPKATTYAIAYYADWCGSCKVLVPKLDEVKMSLPRKVGEKLEFVRFNFTDDGTKASTATMAEEKGLTELYENDGRTGQLKIVDIETGEVLAIIYHTFTVDEIKGALTAVAVRS